jgi:ATP-dependent helicase/nuclease subunit A
MSELTAIERDRAARRVAQTRFDRPLVLAAGAGTGKTTTLVARLLAWCLGPGWEATRARSAEKAARGALPRQAAEDPDRLAAELLTRVVAITFTEAAAAEMATRTATELARLAETGVPPSWLGEAQLPPPEECARRARALLGALDHLAVRTIHSYCRGLLAEHALEAGLHPDLEVDADGSALEEIAAEVVEARLRSAYGEPGDPDLLALAARGCGPAEVAATLVALAAAGLTAAALDRDPLAPAAVAALARRLERACRELAEPIGARLAGAKRVANAQALAGAMAALSAQAAMAAMAATAAETVPAASELAGQAGPDSLAALSAALSEQLPENLLGHLKKWRGGLGASEAALLGDVAGEIAAAAARLVQLVEHLRRIDPDVLRPAFRALRPLLAEVESELRRRGVATFQALLVEAAALLARREAVRRRVRRRIDLLLVDEFQDTDRVQCELLAWLALDGPPEELPRLFLVGDPKQSIYGWRSADLRAYDGFVERVRAAGGELLALSENFRSVPAILDEVGRVVAPLLRPVPGLQPAFEPLLACAERQGDPGFARSGWAPVEYWVSWRPSEQGETTAGGSGAATPGGEATLLEAAAVAADLRALHDSQGVAWGEMALLLRSLGDLEDYLDALRRRGIPFAVGRDKQYYRRREVIEAAAWVRAVIDPADHLALVTVLRSSTVGVPDAALIPLWTRGFPQRLTELAGPDPAALAALATLIEEAAADLPGEVPGLERIAGWEHNLRAAVETLALLRAAFAGEPADRFVARLRDLTLIEPTEAARYLGAYRLANLERFFRQLLDAMVESAGDARAILRALRRSVAEAREAEEGRPAEGEESAVRVLTIHGAKGLDFGHVYLLQLHKKSGGTAPPATEVGRVAEAGEERYEMRLFGVPTPGFDRIEAERRQVEQAERVRTLYVAMTRAKERLVLAGAWPQGVEPLPFARAQTHVDLLRARPEPGAAPADLWAAALAARDGGESGASAAGAWLRADATGALWKLPALRPPEAAPREDASPEALLPEPAAVEREAKRLRAARAAARRRAARPWRGAASAEAHSRLRAAADAAEGEASETAPSRERDAAMAAGGAFHRALEEWDLAADPGPEAERQAALLPSYLAPLAAGEILAPAQRLAEELLHTLTAGPLLARLRALREHLLARELPVLLPPGGGGEQPPDVSAGDDGNRIVGGVASGAVGAIVGAIDLLYRDPQTGEIVVADYKTDALAGEEELAARAAVYAAQGKIYAAAVQQALGLTAPPRFELWFVRAGRIVAA